VWPADTDLIEDHGPPAATPLDEVVVLGKHTAETIQPTASRLPADNSGSSEEVNDQMRARQALLHQDTGNAALADADVTVVGLGGLGSLITTQLAHIGVGRGNGQLTLVDPDVVEESNRSRIIGATPDDAGDPEATPDSDTVVPAQWADDIDALGTPKVDVAERYISDIDPRIRVEKVREVGESEAGIDAMATADLVISAVDQQAPRRNISQVCQQYLRPLVDAGVGINTEDALSLASRVTVAGAGRRCLDCAGALNEDRAIHEQHGEDEPYGVGEQPAVMTVNNEAASRVGFIAHRYLTGLLASDNAAFETGTFDFTTSSTVRTKPDDRDNCPNCQSDSLFRARGDRAPTPAASLTRTKPAVLPESQPESNSIDDGRDDSGVIARLRSLTPW
jgi:tRNA A37 threonylcarbamoyladenosine dehydratase